jgi:hypothetical protein
MLDRSQHRQTLYILLKIHSSLLSLQVIKHRSVATPTLHGVAEFLSLIYWSTVVWLRSILPYEPSTVTADHFLVSFKFVFWHLSSTFWMNYQERLISIHNEDNPLLVMTETDSPFKYL